MKAGALLPVYLLSATAIAGTLLAPDIRFPAPVIQFDAPPPVPACKAEGGCVLVTKQWLDAQAKALGRANMKQAQAACGSRT